MPFSSFLLLVASIALGLRLGLWLRGTLTLVSLILLAALLVSKLSLRIHITVHFLQVPKKALCPTRVLQS